MTVSATDRPWQMKWLNSGEKAQIFAPQTTGSVTWKPASAFPPASTLVWFKASFNLPLPLAANTNATASTVGSAGGGAAVALPPAQISYALSLVGANKGVAYVNGFELGRYWLKPGECQGKCAPPIKNGHCYMHWKGCSKPTQTLYHVPTPVLKPTGNLVVIFEETASVVAKRDLDAVKLVQLHGHPS